ncbi:MAG: hypothetical protein WDN28_19810 [Chthoniobacter sp.]
MDKHLGSTILNGGSAHLPAPLNNIWAFGAPSGEWKMLTEDGFLLAQFFKADPKDVRWPKSAVAGRGYDQRGRERRILWRPHPGGDGKVYLETGSSAYWNLEVTGLEKVKALPGGKITVPPAK